MKKRVTSVSHAMADFSNHLSRAICKKTGVNFILRHLVNGAFKRPHWARAEGNLITMQNEYRISQFPKLSKELRMSNLFR